MFGNSEQLGLDQRRARNGLVQAVGGPCRCGMYAQSSSGVLFSCFCEGSFFKVNQKKDALLLASEYDSLDLGLQLFGRHLVFFRWATNSYLCLQRGQHNQAECFFVEGDLFGSFQQKAN